MTTRVAVHIRSCILVAGLLLAQGCKGRNQGSQPEDAAANITCPQLYQGTNSLADALVFIEVPEDRMESSLASVTQRGQLADSQQLAFANKLFSLRQSRDVELFKTLLSDAARQELDGPDTNNQIVRHVLREIENGTFLYGQRDFKFFATFRALARDELDAICENVSFAQLPTHSVTFYHFHKPNYMLIGTRNYVVQSSDAYRIVTETLLKGQVPSPVVENKPTKPETFGIVSFKQDDEAYSKEATWRYEWSVELTLDTSENNTFEIVKLTDVVAGQDPNLPPGIAEDVLVRDDVIAKYRYEALKFRFRVGNHTPREDYSRHGRFLSGWDYGLSIASSFRGSPMLFPGTNITNIQVHREGGFTGSNLEFLSFETTQGDARYRHRVVLRKTPIAGTSGPQGD